MLQAPTLRRICQPAKKANGGRTWTRQPEVDPPLVETSDLCNQPASSADEFGMARVMQRSLPEPRKLAWGRVTSCQPEADQPLAEAYIPKDNLNFIWWA